MVAAGGSSRLCDCGQHSLWAVPRSTRRETRTRRGIALRMRLRRLGLLLLILVAPLPALAQGRAECGTLTSKILHRPVRYCALLPPSFDDPASKQRKYSILYYLHGRGDNEQTLINTGSWSLVEHLRKQKKISEFVIVTPQGGNSFYINSANGKERYSDFFLHEFMPY